MRDSFLIRLTGYWAASFPKTNVYTPLDSKSRLVSVFEISYVFIILFYLDKEWYLYQKIKEQFMVNFKLACNNKKSPLQAASSANGNGVYKVTLTTYQSQYFGCAYLGCTGIPPLAPPAR